MTAARSAVVGVTLLTLILGGCVVPTKGGFDDVKRQLAGRICAEVRWNQGTKEDQAVAARVHALLAHALTAETAVQIALFDNRRLQATYERLGVTEADLVQAGLLPNPSFGAALGFPLNVAELAYQFSFVQQFLHLFLLPLRKRLARARFEAAKLEVADDVLRLVASVRTAFYTVQATKETLAMQRTILAAAQASAELAARQHAAGNLSELDLANQQGLYAQVRLEVARSEAQLLADREQLTDLLGLWGNDVGWQVGDHLPDLPKEALPLEHVESFAVAHRLDLQAAKARIGIARAALSAVKVTRALGKLDIGASYDHDTEGNRTLGPTFSVEVPIFDQGQAQVARLAAEVREAQRAYEALAVDVRSQVRSARTRVQAGRAVVEYYRSTLVPLRERIVLLSQRQYNAMLLGVYQLLFAKQNEIDAYRDYIFAVRDYWIARADLERVAGGRLGAQLGDRP